MKEDYNISQEIINKLTETSKSSNVSVDSLIKRLIEVYERDFSKVTINIEKSVLNMLGSQAKSKDIMLDAYINNILKAYLNKKKKKGRKEDNGAMIGSDSSKSSSKDKSPEDVLNEILSSSEDSKPNVDL